MHTSTPASAAWRDFREAIRLGQPRARLRLLATVTAAVSHAARSLDPETRAGVCVHVAAALDARIRARAIRSPGELLRALDLELAGWLGDGPGPSSALLARLGDALSALPEAQQRALSAYYGPTLEPPGDTHARRSALAELRDRLALDAP